MRLKMLVLHDDVAREYRKATTTEKQELTQTIAAHCAARLPSSVSSGFLSVALVI